MKKITITKKAQAGTSVERSKLTPSEKKKQGPVEKKFQKSKSGQLAKSGKSMGKCKHGCN